MTTTEDQETEAAPKKGGLLGMLLPVVLSGAVAFAVVYFDPFDQPATEETVAATADGEEASEEPLVTAVLTMEPMVVSLVDENPDDGRLPKLRVAISVEAAANLVEDEYAEITPLLRDGFTDVIRGFDVEILAGTDGLNLLRDSLLERANSVLGEGQVTAILITDFIMT